MPVAEPTDAVLLVLLHTPPGVVLVSSMDAPAHTVAGPLMAPTAGSRLTVMTFVTDARPQAPLMV
jgi:hypothetical protein